MKISNNPLSAQMILQATLLLEIFPQSPFLTTHLAGCTEALTSQTPAIDQVVLGRGLHC